MSIKEKISKVLNESEENQEIQEAASAEEQSTLVEVDVKDDVAALVSGEDLSEEFKQKAATIFEAAVVNKVKSEIAKIQEQYDAAFEQAIAEKEEEIKASLAEDVEKYLDYVVEQWMEQNTVAIESSIRTEISENFIQRMKTLFAESYIEIPDEKADAFAEMADKVAELEESLNEAIADNVEMKRLIDEAQKEAILDEVCEGLADTQVEKLKVLAEGVAFEDAEAYRKKVEIIKESYFADKKKSGTAIVEDEQAAIDPQSEEGSTVVKSSDPVVNRYVDAISKQIKKI
jgi:hypothetical protein